MAAQFLLENKYRKTGKSLFYPTWTSLFDNPSFKLNEYTVRMERKTGENNMAQTITDRRTILSATKPSSVNETECTYVKPLCVSVI